MKVIFPNLKKLYIDAFIESKNVDALKNQTVFTVNCTESIVWGVLVFFLVFLKINLFPFEIVLPAIAFAISLTMALNKNRIHYKIRLIVTLIMMTTISWSLYRVHGSLHIQAPLQVCMLMLAGFVWGPRTLLILAALFTVSELTAFYLIQTGYFQNFTIPEFNSLYQEVFLARLFFSMLFFIIIYMPTHLAGRYMEQSFLKLQNQRNKLAQEIQMRKKMEEQLRQAQKLETLGTMAGGIAHDFNNILTPIMGYSKLAIRQLENNDPVREDLEHVVKGATRAKNLVSQILTFSRQSEQKLESINLPSLLTETVEFVRKTIPASIAIEINTPQEMGEFDRVTGDATQLQQVFINLINNATQAMGNKSGKIEISLSTTKDSSPPECLGIDFKNGNYVLITVSDNGSGMPPKTVERIFDPFFTTKEPGKGTGLGLSVVHGVVKSHEGEIAVSSELGVGTTFTICLPMNKGTSQSEMIPGPNAQNLSTLNVMLIDDEEEILQLIRRILEKAGHSVTTLSNPEAAIRELSQNNRAYHLVITDFAMPKITGDAVIQKLKSVNPHIPIILHSGSSLYSESTQLQDCKADGILRKPYTEDELMKKIIEVIEAKIETVG